LEEASKMKASLPLDVVSRYHPFEYLKDAQASWVMQQTDMVVGRAGANTVYEVAALGKIAVFVPLPWSGGGEQEKNAQFLEEKGSAVVFSQRNATPEALLQAIESAWEKRTTYQERALALSVTLPRDGATRLVSETLSLLPQ
jgi:UDP-N-acetylglucosamine--N-acetylmuramyl-(pentapeptide) pyrophosphoryl-undecaprenol N-acetylglucosamine transferase